ncbi:MAG: translation initiation factor IF-3 [Thiotrichaceae bacterium]|nr:translation initiation factor IF-3 [Thiotrichaceae bacterium]
MAAEKNARINEQINVPKVRLIDADGENVGVVSVQDAQARASEAELDLVEISPSAKPPVCRIMDYGKYLFEQNKKRQIAKKKQKQVQVKEVKFRPTTEDGDYKVKLRNAMRFLEDGDKTKVTIRFRGREVTHQDIGRQLLARLEKDIGELGNVEQRPKMEGRQMVMIISPSKK